MPNPTVLVLKNNVVRRSRCSTSRKRCPPNRALVFGYVEVKEACLPPLSLTACSCDRSAMSLFPSAPFIVGVEETGDPSIAHDGSLSSSLVYTFRPPSRLFFLTALALRHTCETPSLSSRAGPTQKAHSTSTSWTEVNSLALSIRATRAGRPQRLESTSTGQASAHTTWSSPPTELQWRAATRATLTTGERQPFRARTPRARWSRFEPR